MRVAGRPAAVVFDLDGVLIDSEPVWEQVRRGFVRERGGRWPEDAQARLLGMSTAEWASYLSADLGVDLPPDEVADVVIDRMAARYADGLPLIPGADDALRRLSARWPLALASSSPRSRRSARYALLEQVVAVMRRHRCWRSGASPRAGPRPSSCDS